MGKEDIRLIGRIDLGIYNCVASDIMTDEVIITDERIAHIHEGTCIVLKHIQNEEISFQIVMRLQTSKGTAGFKNSVLSAWRISKRRWENYLKNKTILYKHTAD